MAAEPTVISGRGPDWAQVTITGVTTNAQANTSTIAYTPATSISSEEHHYEGGTLTPGGPIGSLFIVESSNNPRTVTINRVLTQQEIDAIVGQFATLRDDDQFAGQLPFFPTMTPFIKNAYAKAYIDIVELDLAYNPNRTVSFSVQLTDGQLITGQGWDNSQDQFSESWFWTSLLVSAYQPSPSGDQDGDAWLGNNANQWGVNYQPDQYIYPGATVEDGDNASAIFIEFLRDVGQYAQKDLDHTIAHEIGHSAADSPTDDDHAEMGIMEEGAPIDRNAFTAKTLRRFRRTDRW